MTLEPRHAGRDMPRRGLALLAMFLAAVFFAVMTTTTKMLGNPTWTRPLPTAEITLARFAAGTLVMLPLAFYKPARLFGVDRKGLLWRGLTGGVAVYTYFLAIRHTSLTNAVLLNLTSVVFAPIISWVHLGERPGRWTVIALLVAAVGIALVIRPDFGRIRVGDVYGMLSGMLAGLALTAVRRLRREETAAAVFFYFSLVGMPIAMAAGIGSPFVTPDRNGWTLLLIMAGSSIAAQVLMTYGYRYLTTAQGVLITLSQIVYSAAAGAVLFAEPIMFPTVMGALLILAGGVLATTVPAQEARPCATR